MHTLQAVLAKFEPTGWPGHSSHSHVFAHVCMFVGFSDAGDFAFQYLRGQPIDLVLSMSAVGPFGTDECEEIVAEFFRCRHENGFSGMVIGKCSILYREMNTCLDEKVVTLV